MKQVTTLILIIHFISYAGFGQEVQKWRGSRGEVSFLKYQASGNPQNYILIQQSGLTAENAREKFGRFVPIANAFNALMVGLDFNGMTDSELLGDFQDDQVMHDSIGGKMYFIGYESNAQMVREMLDRSFSIILIDPAFDSLKVESALNFEAMARLWYENEAECQEELTRDLGGRGFWVKCGRIETSMQIAALKESLAWMDSLASITNDSATFAQAQSGAGLQSNIPDVVTSNSKLDLEFQTFKAGDLRIQVLDLSSKVIDEQSIFLNKGLNRILWKLPELDWGVYHLEFKGAGIASKQKIMIRG